MNDTPTLQDIARALGINAAQSFVIQDVARVAIDFHKTVEGEYGCPGITCPGVKRLIEAFVKLRGVGIREDAKSAAGVPAETPRHDRLLVLAREAVAAEHHRVMTDIPYCDLTDEQNLHQFVFETCPHPDCVLVRAALGVPPAATPPQKGQADTDAGYVLNFSSSGMQFWFQTLSEAVAYISSMGCVGFTLSEVAPPAAKETPE